MSLFEERGRYSRRRGGREEFSDFLFLGLGGGGRVREWNEKRRVREDRKEIEGSVVFL